MKTLSNYSWIIQIIVTIIILLFGFNYTNGKNFQNIEENTKRVEKCENNFNELREVIHKLDKSIDHLNLELKYMRENKNGN
jgi:peptidoglycan hydrolase CwlO-like protein